MRDKDRNERPLAAANGNEQREYNGRKKRVEIIWLQLNNKRICLATPARILANTATRCLLVAGGKWHGDGGMGQGARRGACVSAHYKANTLFQFTIVQSTDCIVHCPAAAPD